MTVSDEGSGRETTDFGFERVALNEKQGASTACSTPWPAATT